MKKITIRFEDDEHKKLKKQLIDEEMTFQEYIITLVNEDLAKKIKKAN